jgi:hypothetical protein
MERSEEEIQAKFEALKDGVSDAIEAMLALIAAVQDKQLSIKDLADGMDLAIAGPRQGDDGHDRAIIVMAMVQMALEQDRDRIRST